ncbi:MAG: hypothetical protein ACI4W0_04385 [Bacilli bacterium]|uniref:Uncharacterized protein n=1 Tax=Floccifex porci TaxID=2606629 RepID=A0A7X2T492_9FIRM|nr:hypothetical protein [Floccifex porci]MSS02359.1 hypothetical protein [Floccifex porci]
MEIILKECHLKLLKDNINILNNFKLKMSLFYKFYVLTNMEIPKEQVECSVRISWRWKRSKI